MLMDDGESVNVECGERGRPGGGPGGAAGGVQRTHTLTKCSKTQSHVTTGGRRCVAPRGTHCVMEVTLERKIRLQTSNESHRESTDQDTVASGVEPRL